MCVIRAAYDHSYFLLLLFYQLIRFILFFLFLLTRLHLPELGPLTRPNDTAQCQRLCVSSRTPHARIPRHAHCRLHPRTLAPAAAAWVAHQGCCAQAAADTGRGVGGGRGAAARAADVLRTDTGE